MMPTDGTIEALGWALLHSVWQIAALALVAAVSLSFLRRPATRYLFGVGILVLMLAVPMATFVAGLDGASAPAVGMVADAGSASEATASTPLSRRVEPPSPGLVRGLMPGLMSARVLTTAVLVWCCGVALLGLRALGALWWVRRLERASAELPRRALELCRDVEHRLGLRRAVHYAASREGEGPAVIGVLRPMVLLPMAALAGLPPEQLRLIVAHELAHIRRWDSLVNLGQVVVETLLFYHPGVWWLSRRVRGERELACDDLVLHGGGRERAVDYARALSSLAALPRTPVLAPGARGGSLTSRVERILGVDRGGSGARGLRLVAAAAGLVVALFATSGLATPQNPLPADRHPAVSLTPSGGEEVRFEAATASSARSDEEPGAEATREEPRERPADGERRDRDAARRASAESRPDGATSYIDELRAAGLDPDVDQLIALKVNGVTGRYVRALAAAGFRPGPDDLIAMRVHGVDPEFVAAVRDAGYQPSKDDLVALRVHGVDPATATTLRAAGFEPTLDDLVALRVHGVDPATATALRAAGFEPTLDDLVALRVHGISPSLAAALATAGLAEDLDDVVAAGIHGVTPEFVDLARSHGFDDLDLDQLIQLRRLGVLDTGDR